MITAWAALESMAARLITEKADDAEIAGLRRMFATFEGGQLRAHLDEYSEVNIEFHQTIIRMSRNRVLIDLAENLFTHMRMIRRKTIGEKDRADRSIRDHMSIIEALERATPTAPKSWCATTRSALPNTWRNMPIIWTDKSGLKNEGETHG